MMHTVLPPLSDHRRPVRRATLIALGVCVAALVAALATVLVSLTGTALRDAATFVPGAEDGMVPTGQTLALTDTDVPALAELDRSLLDAVQRAGAAARGAGVEIRITSGWRDARFQEWLLDDAVQTYGSLEVAREYVALPQDSHHVTGHAVDVGPLDAQLWLMEHGSAYGLCQIYANERWHCELATAPGGICPPQRENAAG